MLGSKHIVRQGLRGWGLLAAGVAILSAPTQVPATSGSFFAYSPEAIASETIVRVEEDWELVLNVPDDNVQSPQFHTIMSPNGDLDSYFGQVLWNYWEEPEFRPGGLQLQGWDGDYLARKKSFDLGPLSTNAETVTWTQALEIDGPQDTLYFGVSGGQSSTWGYFGGSDVRIGKHWSIESLNSYNTDSSVANSCVTYGSNRVDRVRILQVRRYAAGGAVYVDATPRTVFELED